jgi:peptide/nickel transport system permease protein
MVTRPLLWPGQNPSHLLGSDILGRDIMAGIFYGARISLTIGTVATLVAVFVGVIVGSMAGYFGRRVDDVLMRLTELFQTIPPFIFALVIVAILRPSIRTIVVALAVTSWPQVTRLVRGEFIALRDREFVQACHAVGMSNLRIVFTEILPNAMAPVIVTASIMVATAILAESSLAFLGLGDPNVMSWGNIIAGGREMLRTAWYITAIPGVAIILTVLALNLIGDGLNDALNPHLKNR